MGELDFRKKRKNTNIRGTARKQGKNSRQRELRFENEKREKRSSGKRWGKNKKNTKGIVLWAVGLVGHGAHAVAQRLVIDDVVAADQARQVALYATRSV